MESSLTNMIDGTILSRKPANAAGVNESLAGFCTDLFLIVIRMHETENLGEPSALRKLISYYIELFEKNCRIAGVDENSLAAARYGLVALLDETILSIPGSCRDFWLSRPLQLDLFGDNVAGEEFYRKLNLLRSQADKYKEVLEIYYLCLSLGFKGKYKIVNSQEQVQIVNDLGRLLRHTCMRSSCRISPHVSRSDGVVKIRSRSFRFLILLIYMSVTALTGGIYFCLRQLYLSHVSALLELIDGIGAG